MKTGRKRGRPPKFRVQDVAAALRASGGVYTAAAQLLGQAVTHATGIETECVRETIANYVARHKKLQEVMEEIAEINLDVCESHLLGLIRQNNLGAIIWYQRNMGRHRGWGQNAILGNGPPALNEDRARDLLLEAIRSTEELFPDAPDAGPLIDGVFSVEPANSDS